MVDLKIENVIAAIEFGVELDLQKIADSDKNAEYNPDQFPGIVFKLKSPKTVTLIFSKGYSVCTGATSLQSAKAALTIIYKKLSDFNLLQLETIPKIKIQNIIVSYTYQEPLNLAEIVTKLPEGNAEFNPTKFPGLIYTDPTTEIKVLIFKTGVIVGYGSPLFVEFNDLFTELEQYYT